MANERLREEKQENSDTKKVILQEDTFHSALISTPAWLPIDALELLWPEKVAPCQLEPALTSPWFQGCVTCPVLPLIMTILVDSSAGLAKEAAPWRVA